MSRRTLFTAFIISFIVVTGIVPVYAQTVDSKYFSETGHNVKGEFLKFYNNNTNAKLVYGFPITEEFTSTEGVLVQYFQRARFEFNASLPNGQRVIVTPLGKLTYSSASPLSVSNTLSCQTFSQGGFPVCFTFLEFFNKHGGVEQFGQPISAFEYHENKIVQYFEKTRLEWQPWRNEGQRVVVSDLGRLYFDQIGEDPGLLPPVKPLDNSQSAVLNLQVRAFTWKAVTLASDTQYIFIVVQDQNLQPVPNASCIATVHWPDKHNDVISLGTNTNGIGIVPLSFNSQPYGSLIYADVACTYSNLKSNTTTSFRIWY